MNEEKLNITKEEEEFIESIVNHKANIFNVQKYIREEFGLESDYDEVNNKLTIHCNAINESLNAANAKQYVKSIFDEDMLDVVIK